MTQTAYGDSEIRAALHRKKFDRMKAVDDVLVVDELGLAHARSRIDVAVINGCVHGYEIKSEKDTLLRFDSQFETYRQTLERLTVVCASKHLNNVVDRTPDWCGVVEACIGSRGGIHFVTHRRARRNPDVEKQMLSHLLWQSEAMAMLAEYGIEQRHLRKSRAVLYDMIADLMSFKEITAAIKQFMAARAGWRDHPVQVSYDG